MRETCTFFQVHSKKYISWGVKMTGIKGAKCWISCQLNNNVPNDQPDIDKYVY